MWVVLMALLWLHVHKTKSVRCVGLSPASKLDANKCASGSTAWNSERGIECVFTFHRRFETISSESYPAAGAFRSRITTGSPSTYAYACTLYSLAYACTCAFFYVEIQSSRTKFYLIKCLINWEFSYGSKFI